MARRALSLEEQRELNKTLREVYGDDYIIVYQPEGLAYHVTVSHNVPAETMNILRRVSNK
jgi:hypothetical protein